MNKPLKVISITRILLILQFLLLVSCMKHSVDVVEREYKLSGMDDLTANAYRGTDAFLRDCIQHEIPVKAHRRTRIDTIYVNKEAAQIEIYLSVLFGYVPLREHNVAQIYQKLQIDLGKKFQDYREVLMPERLQLPN